MGLTATARIRSHTRTKRGGQNVLTNPDFLGYTSVRIQCVSIFRTCVTIILGVYAWRREFIGRRKIELAEDVLARFYEARDAIARIRSPFGTSSEGSERIRPCRRNRNSVPREFSPHE